jgi:phosphoribosylaminoimidazole (AIR) synthetase
MYRVFNMGVGMVLLLPAEQVRLASDALSGEGVVIGEAVPWDESGPQVQL